MWPVRPARISQPFADPGAYASIADSHGPRGHHTGVDFGAAWPIPLEGRMVRAVMGGEVVISEYNSTMGHWVGVYSHDQNLLVTYWHLQKRLVGVGDWVLPYAPLGRVGNTGNSTAPHLHVQANPGRSFSYHGHVHPGAAFKHISRRKARKAYRKNPRHPQQR